MSILHDPAFRVPAAPAASDGVAWLRANVVRFSEGGDHARRRKLTEDLLEAVDPDALRRPGSPTANLAAALGLPGDPSVVADVAAVAASYQPHADQEKAADGAVARLVERFGGAWDEEAAARIGLLVQAHAAVNAAIAGQAPPVSSTRRIDPSGREVIVDLTDTPFGAGRHECPGQRHAAAMVEGATLSGDRP